MKHVLILEDTLEVQKVLLGVCAEIERKSGCQLRVTVYSTSRDVAELVNNQEPEMFDAIILDRNCKLGGSFHVLDIDKFGAEKIISISSLPHLNDQARARGVKSVVEKDHRDLDAFASSVAVELEQLLC